MRGSSPVRIVATMPNRPVPHRPRLGRRHALCCGAAAVGGLFGSLLDTAAAGEDPNARPALPPPARALVEQALDGLAAAQLWDVHTHLLGTGDAGSGCWANPQLDSWWHPFEALRKRVILRGAGVAGDSRRVDLDYAQRLTQLTRDFPRGARWLLFAFDHGHDDAGAPQPELTTFHVPDSWAASVAQQRSDRFGWAASIHPYRVDALVRLDHAIAHGALAATNWATRCWCAPRCATACG